MCGGAGKLTAARAPAGQTLIAATADATGTVAVPLALYYALSEGSGTCSLTMHAFFE